jgi:hypothetical protein
MSDDQLNPTADIISFRRPTAIMSDGPQADAAIPSALAEDPNERLTRALRLLEAAQAEQRLALAKWRVVIGDLSSSVNSLGSSLTEYQSNLAEIAGKLLPPG